MAYAFVQQDHGSSGSTARTTAAVTNGITPTAGNLVYIELTYFAAAQRTFNFPATWGTVQTVGTDYFDSAVGFGLIRRYVANCAAVSGNGSGTFSGGTADYPAMRISEYSGLGTTSPLIVAGAVNKQTNPGTGAGSITAAITPTSQPAMLLGSSVANVASNWNTAVSHTGRAMVWDYTSGTSFSMKPQDTRVTSTAATNMTWTTSAGVDIYWSWITAFAEAGVPKTISPSGVASAAAFGSHTVTTATKIRVVETLINETGAPLANLTGITVLLWRGTVPSGAPDQVLTGQTTDQNGATSWVFDRADLDIGDSIVYLAYAGDPMTSGTVALIQPEYF